MKYVLQEEVTLFVCHLHFQGNKIVDTINLIDLIYARNQQLNCCHNFCSQTFIYSQLSPSDVHQSISLVNLRFMVTLLLDSGSF